MKKDTAEKASKILSELARVNNVYRAITMDATDTWKLATRSNGTWYNVPETLRSYLLKAVADAKQQLEEDLERL